MKNELFLYGFKCCQILLTPCFQQSKTGLIDKKEKVIILEAGRENKSLVKEKYLWS